MPYTVTKRKTRVGTPGNRTPKLPQCRTPEEFEQNQRLINHILQTQELAKYADRNDVNTLKSCFANYLRLCQENGQCVSNLGAYTAMGMTAQQWASYSRREDPEIKAFCTLVKSTCSMFRESLIIDGKINPITGIFWQRNFDGLRNDVENFTSNAERDDEAYTQDGVYKEKYKRLIGE